MSVFWHPVVSEAVAEHALAYRHDELVLRRFWAKVDWGFEATDCAVWTGALSDEGYGDVRIGGKTLRAHRVAWLWANGMPPEDAPFLDHATSCVGRFCVNIAHLEPVDNAENQRRRQNVGSSIQRELRRIELAMRDERRAAGDYGII